LLSAAQLAETVHVPVPVFMVMVALALVAVPVTVPAVQIPAVPLIVGNVLALVAAVAVNVPLYAALVADGVSMTVGAIFVATVVCCTDAAV
jgi:hypothetical protein